MLKKEDFEEILKDYKIGTYKGHKHLENVLQNYVYILKTNKGKYILKLMDNVNLKNMKKQLEVIDFLYKNKVPVVKNIKNREGNEIVKYKKGSLVIQGFIKGNHPRRFNNLLTKDIGRNIGKMHKALLKFKEANRKNHNYTMKDLEKCIHSVMVRKIQNKLLKEIKKINKSKLKEARIHGDISEVNLLVNKNKLNAFIDWDDSDYDYLVYELSIFIAHSFVRSNTIYWNKIKIFLSEYQKYVKLNEEEKKAIYFLIKYRQFGIISWHLKYMGSHKGKYSQLKEGLKRSVNRLENFDKISLKEFLDKLK
mgnify:FL=1